MGKILFQSGTKKIKDEVIGVGAENLDYLIKLLTEDEVIKDIPLVGQIVRLLKFGDSVANYLFAQKMMRFMNTVNDKSTEKERNVFSEKLKEDKELRDDLYSTIFMKIDNFDDLSKPNIFAKIYACLITNKIKIQEYNELSFALSESSLPELNKLSKAYWMRKSDKYSTFQPWQEFVNCSTLNASGLMKLSLKEDNKTGGNHRSIERLLEELKSNYELSYDLSLIGKLYVYISKDMENGFKLIPSQPRFARPEKGWSRCSDYFFDETLEVN